jgi:D-amino-acid dehydrogenase
MGTPTGSGKRGLAYGPLPSHDGLSLATGHATLGLTLGLVTGELIAGMISGETNTNDLEPISPGRF